MYTEVPPCVHYTLCSDIPAAAATGANSCDQREERACRREIYRGCWRSMVCQGCETCVCFGCEMCCFRDCNCHTCHDFYQNVEVFLCSQHLNAILDMVCPNLVRLQQNAGDLSCALAMKQAKGLHSRQPPASSTHPSSNPPRSRHISGHDGDVVHGYPSPCTDHRDTSSSGHHVRALVGLHRKRLQRGPGEGMNRNVINDAEAGVSAGVELKVYAVIGSSGDGHHGLLQRAVNGGPGGVVDNIRHQSVVNPVILTVLEYVDDDRLRIKLGGALNALQSFPVSRFGDVEFATQQHGLHHRFLLLQLGGD
nr:protein ULTRAPETALA 1-like [Ipomoea batatas]